MVEHVIVSPKYQVVIPKAIREAAGIKPGQELKMSLRGGAIRVSRVRTMDEMFGLYPNLPPFVRDKRDRNPAVSGESGMGMA